MVEKKAKNASSRTETNTTFNMTFLSGFDSKTLNPYLKKEPKLTKEE